MTIGLPDALLSQFLANDPTLTRAIDEALEAHRALRGEHEAELRSDEADLGPRLQADLVNFYPDETVNPYVALAAAGPWVVTSHGAVIHDSGGYGMLGMGHGPTRIMDAMSKSWVMANVMTPSFSQKRLTDRLRAEIGHRRGSCPYARFLCLNSGSESVTVAARISDVNAARNTAPGGAFEGKSIAFLGLEGGFHGRTSRPAQVSDSCLDTYRKHLASFRDNDNLLTVVPNDTEGLKQAFVEARERGLFLEAMFMEPVMGEGNPGMAITREFYDLARELTLENHCLLLVDSIQAGIRTQGCLSIVDFPGFEDCEAPDMETYSKALNAGQYPLSVLALHTRAAELYVSGIYGNTMTTNPRALEVACEVLDSITPELRQNIVARGAEFVEKLQGLATEFPGAITGVQGTGLLLAAELDPEHLKVVGYGQIEQFCRVHGIGVIHGGKNALRFTPHFAINSAEIDAIVSILRSALQEFWASQRNSA